MNVKKTFLSLLVTVGLVTPFANASNNPSYLNNVNENSPIVLKHASDVQSDKYFNNNLNQNGDNIQNLGHYSHRSHSSHHSHSSHRSHYSSY